MGRTDFSLPLSLVRRSSSQGTKERFSPTDPKSLVCISQGSMANPLNIKPSSNGLGKSPHFPPLRPLAPKKKRMIVGRGWPRVRPSDEPVVGKAIPTSTESKFQVQIPLPVISSELPFSCPRDMASTHSSIPPGISNIVSHTSPSSLPSQLPHSPSTSNWRPVVDFNTHMDQGTILINGRHSPPSLMSYPNHSTRAETSPRNGEHPYPPWLIDFCCLVFLPCLQLIALPTARI